MKKIFFPLAATLSTALVTLSVSSPVFATAFKSSVVASGLLSPRGITFGPDGNLYLAEAGSGGSGTCIIAGSGQQVCYGATGAISQYNPNTQSFTRSIVNLPSLATATGEDGTGIHDLYFNNGTLYGVLGLGANPSTRVTLNVPDFGQVIAINLSGTPSWSLVADISGFEATDNPDGGGVDSNPYSLAIQNGVVYVTDAGGNSLLKAQLNGTVSLEQVFPIRPVTPPPFIPGLPNPFPMEAVPTGIALGPDNALYIAQLTGFPFPVGGANVYRLAGGTLETYATGFTNIIDLAFGTDGSLYVLEYATDLLAGNLQGNVWQVKPDGTRRKLFSDGLESPTGIAVNDDGTIYVANKGAIAGQGELLALRPVPEPSSVLSLFSWVLLAGFFKRVRGG